MNGEIRDQKELTMKFVNLLPHAVNFPDRTIEPSGTVARLAESHDTVGDADGIALVRVRYEKKPEALPDVERDTILIVSAMMRTAYPERKDLASPGDPVRDESGKITGCKNLIVN